MSDTTETENADEVTTEDTQGAEISAEALQAVAQATARAEFDDALRPPAPAEAATAADDEPQGAEGDAEGVGDPTNHEAARWRTKLRETETRLEAMQRAAVDSQVAALGVRPAAFWAAGTQLGELLGEDGVPDATKVEQATTAAKDTLGITVFKPIPARLQSGAMTHQPKRDSWVEAFAPQQD